MLKKIFHVYTECLYELDRDQIRIVEPRISVTYTLIDSKNYSHVQNLRPGKFYIRDFKKMLALGDWGIYVCVNGKPVGYGWGKRSSSDDYFFKIENCYLCRFFVHSDYRGLNLYPAMVFALVEKFYQSDVSKFYIAADESNAASLRGIEKVGFKFLKKIRFVRFLKRTLNKYQLD